MKTGIHFLILLFVFAFLISCSSSLVTQKKYELNLNRAYVDSIRLMDSRPRKLSDGTKRNLCGIYNYNKLMKHLNQTDTIRTFLIDGKYKAKYKRKWLNLDYLSISREGLITIWGSKGFAYKAFAVSTYGKLGESKRICVNTSNSELTTIYFSNYKNDVIFGEYKEMTWEGEILSLGNYRLIDSVYQDTINDIELDEIRIYSRKHFSEKCGNWIIQNETGETETIDTGVDCN